MVPGSMFRVSVSGVSGPHCDRDCNTPGEKNSLGVLDSPDSQLNFSPLEA